MDAQEILERLSDYFSMSNPINDMLRWIGFGLIKLLFWIISFLEKAVEQTYTLGGLIESSKIDTLFSNVMPIAWALLTIAILIYGYQILTGNQLFKKEIITNLLLAIGIFAILPWLLIQLNSMTNDVFQYAQNQSSDENQSTNQLATQLLKTNINDILWIAKNNYQVSEDGINNNISEENLKFLSINEKINTSEKEVDGKGKKERMKELGLDDNDVTVFDKYIAVDWQFNKSLQDVPRMDIKFIGNFELFSQFYYRYTFNLWALTAQFIAISLALVATSFKVVRLFMEITFSKIIAPFIATTDLSTGQRMKALIKDILINYSALALIPFVMQIYIIGVGWLTVQDFNWVVTSIIIFAMSYFLIDGPEIAKRILGIDLGLQDGWRVMMGAMAMGTAGAKGVGLATQGASNVADKISNNERLQGIKKGTSNLVSATMKDTMNDAKNAIGSGVGKLSESELGQNLYSFGKKAGRRYGEMADALKDSTVGQTAQGIKDSVKTIGDVYSGETDTFKSPNNPTNLQASPQDLANTLANVNSSLQPDSTGATNPMDAVRNVSELVNTQPTSDNDRQQLISAMLQGATTGEAQQRINGLLSNINDPESKQQMISSLLNSSSVGLEEKNQLVSGVMSGAIEGNPSQMVQDIVTGMNNQPEKQQQLIEAMVTNSSIPNESKQQLVEAVMSNKDMGVEAKTQILNTMTSNTPNTESKTQMINSIANGEAGTKTQQAFVNEVLSSADRGAKAQIKNVEELINSNASPQDTATKLVNAIYSNNNDPSMQTQMINKVMQGSDNMASGLKTQFVSQAVTGEALNSSARSQLVNTIFNGNSEQPLSNSQQRVLSEVLSSGSGVSHKNAYLNEIYNKADPVAKNRSEFVNMIRGSNIETGIKEAIVNQAEFSYSSKNQSTLSNQINSVMNTKGLDDGLKNNIIHEISNPSSVYKEKSFKDIVTTIDDL